MPSVRHDDLRLLVVGKVLEKSAAFRSAPLPKRMTFEQRMPRGSRIARIRPAFPDCETMTTGPASAICQFIIASRDSGT